MSTLMLSMSARSITLATGGNSFPEFVPDGGFIAMLVLAITREVPFLRFHSDAG